MSGRGEVTLGKAKAPSHSGCQKGPNAGKGIFQEGSGCGRKQEEDDRVGVGQGGKGTFRGYSSYPNLLYLSEVDYPHQEPQA